MDVHVVSIRGSLQEPESGLDLNVQVATGWWRWKRVRVLAMHARWVPFIGRPKWDGRWSIGRLQSLTVEQENELRRKLQPYLRAFEPTRDRDLDDEDTIPNYRVRKRHSLGDP